MKLRGFTLALAGLCAGSAMGQTPAVTEIANIYSWTLAGLPNYGTAKGSIFAVFGTNLSATTVPLQGGPLKTTLSGVTLNVTVNGTAVQPLLYYLSPTQINAVLPSATPAGTGTLTVTNGSGTSAGYPIKVVESAFGLLTFNYGSGPLAGFNASNNGAYLGFTAAANPGDVLELWGTGLGPVADDAAGGPVSDAATVYIGGVAVTPQYQGRSSYTGLDQINVEVPQGVTGCNVSVVVKTGDYVSNFGTLPVAATGRTCSDDNNPLTGSILNQIAQSGTLSIGAVSLNESTTQPETIDGIVISPGGTTDSGSAGFFKITYSQLVTGAYSTASVGSCTVSFYNASASSQTPPPAFTFTYLNAGPNVNINGPDGLIAMPLKTETVQGTTYESYTTPSADTSFIPAAGGSFTFDNGSGGPDVGAFTASLNLASPLVWSNINSISTVTRANGQLINWTGGDPGTFVSINGFSYGAIAGSSTDFVVGGFICQAPASAGSFTVPSAVLLSMPQSTTVAGVSFSSLAVSNVSAPVTFKATGLDLGVALATFESSIAVTYQ